MVESDVPGPTWVCVGTSSMLLHVLAGDWSGQKAIEGRTACGIVGRTLYVPIESELRRSPRCAVCTERVA